ncbi:hypothetical protein ACP70R_043408 [Stipagrostis hirtigluma subsp. patula]
MKAEAGAESTPTPTRRGDMPTTAATPPPQQARIVVATAPGDVLAAAATPPLLQCVTMTPRPPGFAPVNASPDGGERFATAQGVLDIMAGAFRMVQKIVVELEQKELELQAARCEVAELKVELGAAKAGHVAEDVCLLRRRRGGHRRRLAPPRQ